MDHLVVGFLIYAVLFRLAVIAAGIVTIILGYKLFLRDITGEGKTGLNAQAGRIKLTISNTGPGAIFALLGSFIIAVMLSGGGPELLVDAPKQPSVSQSKNEESGGLRIQMKGEDKDKESSEALQRFDQAYDEGVQQKRAGNTDGAITAYNKALSESEVPLGKAADVLNELAWIYKEQHRLDEALALARIATTVDQNNANAFDTLALILLDRKEHKAAEQAAEKAVSLDSDKQDYKATLQKIRAAQEAAQ